VTKPDPKTLGFAGQRGLTLLGTWWTIRPNSIGRKEIQQTQPLMKKIIVIQLLYNIEKVLSIYFLFTVLKKLHKKRKNI